MAVAFTVVPILGYLEPGRSPLVFIGLLPALVGLLMIFGLGRSAWIKTGESTITYLPAVGRAKVFPRSDVKSIVRAPGAKGLARLEFHGHDNKLLVSCEESFARGDVEKLSQFLGVELIWDLNAYMRTASFDEFKAHLDPEQLAEMEKHMKRPGGGQ